MDPSVGAVARVGTAATEEAADIPAVPDGDGAQAHQRDRDE